MGKKKAGVKIESDMSNENEKSFIKSYEVVGAERPFIQTDVVEALMKGSYEDKVRKVSSLVGENRKLFLSHDVDDISVSPVATFDSHVIVATDEGKLFKSEIAMNEDDGSYSLGNVEEMEIPSVDAQHLKDFRESKLSEMIDDFCRNKVFDRSRMKDLVSLNSLIG